jgi:DHA1 family tetracycline resistance protein-like MFS transporter
MIALLGYAFSTQSWMVYLALIPGALGGLSSPAMQGILSTKVGPDQQGELQGGLASVMSLTSIISPLMMTQTFGYFSSDQAPVYFPGAAFLLAAILTAVALLMFIRIARSPDYEKAH